MTLLAGFLVFAFAAIWWSSGFWFALVVMAVATAILVGAMTALGLEEKDDIEVPKSWKTAEPLAMSVDARLQIVYVDAEGERSKRKIRAFEYVDSSPGYIKAHCAKAHANRTFRTDRIREAVDLETGEIIKRIPTFMRSKATE